MPKNDGHARFELFELAQMLTFRLFSDAGLGLEQAKEWMPFVPATIIKHALSVPGAIEGDGERYKALAGPLYAGNIARQFSNVFCGGPLMIWADNTTEIVADPETAQISAPPEKIFGVVRIIDLEIVGEELARRAGRALVRVQWI
ncbi:hypothetical protein [Methylocystis sp. ATCC 49242]|uniref:hypothetical protein n=1 Tax=Methylocystis sp. ATCC 49242 TaxID=622637 RepID=UPI0001F88851|nr:hypothetical protein [Methylocystis sp. ATCC 49242]